MKANCVSFFVIVALVRLLCIMTTVNVTWASSSNWVEVARYSGSAFPDIEEFDTEGFVADHEEWRIRWSYDAVGSSLESMLMIGNGGDMIVISTSYFDESGVRNRSS